MFVFHGHPHLLTVLRSHLGHSVSYDTAHSKRCEEKPESRIGQSSSQHLLKDICTCSGWKGRERGLHYIFSQKVHINFKIYVHILSVYMFQYLYACSHILQGVYQ